MRPFKAAPPTPFLVFGVAAIAFAGWLTYDAAHAPAAAHSRTDPNALRADDDSGGLMEERLGALYPGQPRMVVEQQLNSAMLPRVDPIDLSGGKPVCREHYHVHLSHAVPNIPLARPEAFSPGAYILTVEFDVGSPEHPLSRMALALAPAPRRPSRLPPRPAAH